jgi:hypothetical protein
MGAQEQQIVAQLGALAVSVLTGLISALALFVCLRINVSIAALEVKILRELQAYVRKEDCRRVLIERRALRDCAEEAP